jgi:hypothetical protein
MKMKNEISSNFTIKDIHEVRRKNYEAQKAMSLEERFYDTARQGMEAMTKLGLHTGNFQEENGDDKNKSA